MADQPNQGLNKTAQQVIDEANRLNSEPNKNPGAAQNPAPTQPVNQPEAAATQPALNQAATGIPTNDRAAVQSENSEMEAMRKELEFLRRENQSLHAGMQQMQTTETATKEKGPTDARVEHFAKQNPANQGAKISEEEAERRLIAQYGEGYVKATKGNNETYFSKVTWNQLPEGKEGWKPVVTTPPEVQNLQKTPPPPQRFG